MKWNSERLGRVELRQLGGVQGDLGNAALAINLPLGLVSDGPLDVADGTEPSELRPAGHQM
jgi:cytolysin (calcineurin-like family phosphatase)